MTLPLLKSTKKKSLSQVVRVPLKVYVRSKGSAQNKENDGITLIKKRIATGMEKAEEKEGHLQIAIESQKAALNGNNPSPSTSIPIRLVEPVNFASNPLLQETYSKQLAKRNKRNLDAAQSLYDIEEEHYDLDGEDIDWLSKVANCGIRILQNEFETAIEVLELGSRKQVVSFAALCSKLENMDRNILGLIYDYWLDKRIRITTAIPTATLMSYVRSEGDYEETNPYIAFREREKGSRRSSRIAFSNSVAGKASRDKPAKTEEEKKAEKAEHLERLSYSFELNSEIDGPFQFKRSKMCSYKKPGGDESHE